MIKVTKCLRQSQACNVVQAGVELMCCFGENPLSIAQAEFSCGLNALLELLSEGAVASWEVRTPSNA